MGKTPAAVVAENAVAPASPEHIDYLWQREAAISAPDAFALDSLTVTTRGRHRREESFAEVARDTVNLGVRRVFGKIASIGSGIRTWGRSVRENFMASDQYENSGTLADIGFDINIPNSPAAATGSFSDEELDELRRIVREKRHEQRPSRIYESQNK